MDSYRVPAFALVARLSLDLTPEELRIESAFLTNEEGETSPERLDAHVWSGATAMRVAHDLTLSQGAHEPRHRVFFIPLEAKVASPKREDWRTGAINCGVE